MVKSIGGQRLGAAVGVPIGLRLAEPMDSADGPTPITVYIVADIDGRTLTITPYIAAGITAPSPTLAALTLDGEDVLAQATGTGPWQYTVPSSASVQAVAWTVTAANGTGTATASGEVFVEADLGPPAQMQPPTLTGGPTTLSITLAPDPEDGGSPITAREWQIDLDGEDFSTPVHTGSGATGTVSAAAPGVYRARSRAVNATGNGPWSSPSNPATVTALPNIERLPSFFWPAGATGNIANWAAPNAAGTAVLSSGSSTFAARGVTAFSINLTGTSSGYSTGAVDIPNQPIWIWFVTKKRHYAGSLGIRPVVRIGIDGNSQTQRRYSMETGLFTTGNVNGSTTGSGTFVEVSVRDIGGGLVETVLKFTPFAAIPTGRILISTPDWNATTFPEPLEVYAIDWTTTAPGVALAPVETYETRDPTLYPFADDSLWYTPIKVDADLSATTAFTHWLGTGGNMATGLRIAPEEDTICIGLGPVADPPSLTGVDAGDLTAARGGHPESPNVVGVQLRSGSSIGAQYPNRSPASGGIYFSPTASQMPADLQTVATNEGWAFTGLPIDENWYKSNKRWENMTTAERDEYFVTWEGGGSPWQPDFGYQGNACTTFIHAHPVTLGTVMLQSLSVERPAAADRASLGLPDAVWGFGTASNPLGMAITPNSVQTIEAGRRLSGRGRLGIEAGGYGTGTELYRGATAVGGHVPPARQILVKDSVSAADINTAASYYDVSRVGAHGGSGLSAVGSTIKLADLNRPGTEYVGVIRHALGLNVSSRVVGENFAGLPSGYSVNTLSLHPWLFGGNDVERAQINHYIGARRWPAYQWDSGAEGGRAAARYRGTDNRARMGAHLALVSPEWKAANPASPLTAFDITTLDTVPARRIAWALMYYGGYFNDIVPDSLSEIGQSTIHFCVAVESRYRPYQAVGQKHYDAHREFFRRWGHPWRMQMSGGNLNPANVSVFANPSGNAAAWYQDNLKIMRALVLVDSTGPLTPGGGVGAPTYTPPVNPISVLGGMFTIGGVPQPFGALALQKHGPNPANPDPSALAWYTLVTDVFNRQFVNQAKGLDVAAGAAIWANLDRGWYRVGNGSVWSPAIWLELGAQKLGTWALA